MPDDKDFKRLVRARMTDTGERYTTARAKLRPAGTDAPPAQAGPAGDIVPIDYGGLLTWRTEHRPHAADQRAPTTGSDWELSLDAGADVGSLDREALDLALVTALGEALGGVGYIALGLEVALPAPEGADPDDPKAPPTEARRATLGLLQQINAEFRQALLDQRGAALPPATEYLVGRPQRRNGDIVCLGKGTTTILVGADEVTGALVGHVDPWEWLEIAGALQAMPSIAYGVVLRLRREFPQQLVPRKPPPDFEGPVRPALLIGDEFWDGCRDMLVAAASAAGLPPWPARHGRLRDRAAGAGYVRHWQNAV